MTGRRDQPVRRRRESACRRSPGLTCVLTLSQTEGTCPKSGFRLQTNRTSFAPETTRTSRNEHAVFFRPVPNSVAPPAMRKPSFCGTVNIARSTHRARSTRREHFACIGGGLQIVVAVTAVRIENGGVDSMRANLRGRITESVCRGSPSSVDAYSMIFDDFSIAALSR